MKPDVLVVGGGIIGLMSAWELRRAGLRVALLERGATGREASWAGGGILSPLHPWRFPAAVTRLARIGQGRFPEIAAQLTDATGIDPEWTRSGLLVAPADERDEARHWAADHGISLEEWPAPAVSAAEPNLSWPAESALWLPDVAQIRNPRLLKALRTALEQDGVVLHEGEPVVEILTGRERVTGVRTARDRWDAGAVVLAAGAWTNRLLAPLGGLPSVYPVRGQMILIRGAAGLLTRIVLGEDHYLIPRRDGRVLSGSTVEEVGEDRSVTESARNWLWERATARVPALQQYPIEMHWSGLRPGNPRETPYIGTHPSIEGLFVSAGHFRNGLVLAPGSARLLTELITGTEPSLDPAEYALESPRNT